MKLKSSNKELEEISIEDISNMVHDLENVNSFFILEKGNCSYIQAISYKGYIIIEERIYEDDSFKHYILTHKEENYRENDLNKINSNKNDSNKDNLNKNNFNNNNSNKNYLNENNLNKIDSDNFNDSSDNNSSENGLVIDDENFKIYNNEIFSINEAIDLFTDYYLNFPLNKIKRKDITYRFPKLEKGYIFIKWLPSAVDRFKESLEEFISIMEPFVVDELKKDCIAKKIAIDSSLDIYINNNQNTENSQKNQKEEKNFE